MPNLIPKLWANLPLLLLSVAMVVGAVWARRVWQETRGEDDVPDGSPDDLLEQCRAAHAAGELDDAEFDRVRALLKRSGSRDRDAAGLWDRHWDGLPNSSTVQRLVKGTDDPSPDPGPSSPGADSAPRNAPESG